MGGYPVDKARLLKVGNRLRLPCNGEVAVGEIGIGYEKKISLIVYLSTLRDDLHYTRFWIHLTAEITSKNKYLMQCVTGMRIAHEIAGDSYQSW